MKLAALYTVWNGLELLEPSIAQIYIEVDAFVICWQRVSNKGEVNNDVEAFVKRFKGFKYHVIEFAPDLAVSTKQNERNKHQMMISYAKKLSCSHYLFSATDHFYNLKQFQHGKKIAELGCFDVTFTNMFTYYKQVTWQLIPIEAYFMPFICKLRPETVISRVQNYPVRVDPSVQVNTYAESYVFTLKQVALHHYSMIRVDIDNKFRNAAASMRWTPQQIRTFKSEYNNYSLSENKGITYFSGRKVVEVPDYFNLSNVFQS